MQERPSQERPSKKLPTLERQDLTVSKAFQVFIIYVQVSRSFVIYVKIFLHMLQKAAKYLIYKILRTITLHFIFCRVLFSVEAPT
jgi:hypothetical protein